MSYNDIIIVIDHFSFFIGVLNKILIGVLNKIFIGVKNMFFIGVLNKIFIGAYILMINIKGRHLYMVDNIKLYSDIERYEIININDGEKYNCLANNDIVVDEDGYLKLLIININNSKFSLFSSNEFMEIPWDYVKKIGARTIILDAEEQNIKRTKP